jgi:hypothetical protein
MKQILLLTLSVFCLQTVFAQKTVSSAQATTPIQPVTKYDNRDVFDASFLYGSSTPTRGESGSPGPNYWQNSASYKINVELNELTHTIVGEVEISYTNASPTALNYLWLQLDQNMYSKNSIEAVIHSAGGSRRNAQFDGGYTIGGVAIEQNGDKATPNTIIDDTRMQIRLTTAVAAKGGKIKIKIPYSFKITDGEALRMGRGQSADGAPLYEIAQWYPRMCVYDDIQGWNVLPYSGSGEFYCDYGDYEYSITANSALVVVGSGELINRKECLTKEQNKRWEQAEMSDKTVLIIPKTETRPSDGKTTWKFKMTNARDVAWAACKSFMLDGARINLPSGKTALALSAYPPETADTSRWGRSTEYAKASIEFYSKYLMEYPYPVAVNVAGPEGGMEYPGLVFCSADYVKGRLWGVTRHEFGHIWFPMIVGSNERKFGWMDEGFNTFINILADRDFNNHEYDKTPIKDKFSARGLFPDTSQSIMTIADAMDGRSVNRLVYNKPGWGMNVLREVILGRERFDYAFQQYTRTWAFKHPTPMDFFKCMENGAGEELGWFWKEWYYKDWKFDIMVKDVSYQGKTTTSGSIVTIELMEKMALPLDVEITYADETKERMHLPIDCFMRGSQYKFKPKNNLEIKRISLDPDGLLPDVNRANNVWDKK